MEFRFDVEKWSKLSPDEQSQRCHQIASEVRKLAREDSRYRRSYLALAESLENLAVAIERDSN
jgi:hypothetical protein